MEAAAPALPRALAERRSLAVPLVLAGLFVAAAVYHALQAIGHTTPAVFTDELLYAKVAQSLAAGHGFTLRGTGVSFPAALPMLAQAPAWLVGDTETGYALAKALNAALMSTAVFPAYWLARQLARPAYALVAAGLTVAAPALVYHSYLLSEALAYPVFLLAVAVLVRAWTRPSPRWNLAVLGVSGLAVGTRVQFAALPLAYLVVVAVRGRRELRAHALAAGGIALAGAALLVLRGAALGPYAGAASLGAAPLDVLRWSVRTGALVPFAAGIALVPAAVLAVGRALVRPARRAEAAFGVLVFSLTVVTLLQAGFVAAGEANRPLERYAIYLPPLLFCAFALALERGLPRPRLLAGTAAGLGAGAWFVPFPALADYLFSFDSPTLSAYGELAHLAGNPNAATAFSGGAFVLCLVVAWRRSGALAAGLSAAVLLSLGVAAYAGDRAMTERTRTAFVASDPDWLDARALGPALYLELPGASAHLGWTLESWNRSLERTAVLEGEPLDVFSTGRATIAQDGRLLVDGRPPALRVLVAGVAGTRLELDGAEPVAAVAPGLVAWRLGTEPRVRSLAEGLASDGWAGQFLRYRAWPAGGGRYLAELALPDGFRPRTITATAGGAEVTVRLDPGARMRLEVTGPGPLILAASDSDYVGAGTTSPRRLGFRVLSLSGPRGAPLPRLGRQQA